VLLVKPETLPLALDTCTEGVLPKLDAFPSGLTVILTSGSCKISGVPTVLQDTATYTIKATNLAGDSTATVSIGVSLGIPRNRVATKGDAVINLTWNPVSGATGYKIYYSPKGYCLN
jgi:hypothetical protein